MYYVCFVSSHIAKPLATSCQAFASILPKACQQTLKGLPAKGYLMPEKWGFEYAFYW